MGAMRYVPDDLSLTRTIHKAIPAKPLEHLICYPPDQMAFSLFAASLLTGASALLPLTIKDNKFYQLQEDYNAPAQLFTIFGVDYQPGGSSNFNLEKSSDALTDAGACQRDAYLLNQLGANAIRIYSVSPWLNHDECMTIFNNAGIYVLLDVNTPDSSINRDDPSSSYTSGYLNNVFGLVDAFKKFPNLLGFIAGNEIINDDKSASKDPTYLRAVIRDLKQYIYEWSERSIPVGYAAADVLEYRTETWEYLQCATGNATLDEWSRADFFGINSYEWCSGVNDYQSSGYGDILSTFNSSSIPIVFTEYGCNTKSPRSFDEVDGGIYGPLKDVLSGAFVYEYSNEVSNYGLVEIDDSGNVSILKDYDNLKSAFANVTTVQGSATVTSTPTGTAALSGVPSCTSTYASGQFDWSFQLPTCPGLDLIKSNGGNRNVGTLEPTLTTAPSNYTIQDANGSTLTPTMTYASSFQTNVQKNVPSSLINQAVRGSASNNDFASSSTSDSGPSSSSTSSSSSASSSATSSKSGSAASTNKKAKANGATSLGMGLSAGLGAIFATAIGLLL